MIKLEGKYNEAIVYTDNMEDTAREQIIDLLNQDFAQDAKIRIMPDCLTEDTEVLTSNGFKYISSLKDNELVANYKNGEIFFKKVKNIIIRNKRENERVYKYYSKALNISLTVSENHRMALKQDMNQLAKNTPCVTLSDMILNGDYRGDYSKYNSYDVNYLLLLLWTIGDGSYCYSNNKTSIRVRFDFRKERKRNRIIELLTNLNMRYSICGTNKVIHLNTMDSQMIHDILGKDKQYPVELIYVEKYKRELMIDELIKIDGDYANFINKNTYRLNSKQKSDIDFFQTLMCLTNKYTSFRQRVTNGFGGENKMYYCSSVSEPRVINNKSGFGKKKILREEINYDGKLVCIECDSSYFVARQNGIVFITGNCHAGAGCVIGFTADLGDKVIPNLVGVDIGCGMITVELEQVDIDLEFLDDIIHRHIPSGFKVHEGRLMRFPKMEELYCHRDLRDTKRIERSIGTLGSGNHFLELNIDNQGNKYLVIHSGSRNLGHQVATYYQNIAIDLCSGKGDYYTERERLVKEYKEQDRRKEIQQALVELKKKYDGLQPTYPRDLCFLTGEWRDKYLHDMKICQEYADLNREVMAGIILKNLLGKSLNDFNYFHTVHNYIDFEHNLIRKGAIAAHKGQKVLIPINMRDGSILALGKGNPDWNFSAPHGAGRLMSRSKARESLSLGEFKQTMENVYTTSVSEETIDEAPMAYKPIDEIISNAGDTIDILEVIKPIYNYKAH